MLDLIKDISIDTTLILTIMGLYFTIKSYNLKKGQQIRGSYLLSCCKHCDDAYVKSIELENYKDKTVIIYAIYLKVGHNYYIELDNFEQNPLNLNPFEVYRKEYNPIDLYSINLNPVSIDRLLHDKKVKKQLVLSTSKGKYKVRKRIKYWSPLTDSFENETTRVIDIDRTTYKNISYGVHVKYIIDLKYKDLEEVVPIYNNDFNRFKDFEITEAHLETKESLEEYLNQMKIQGKFQCEEFQVSDMEMFREQCYRDYGDEKIELNYYNWFNHYIVGRVVTLYSNYKLNRENKHLQKKAKEMDSYIHSTENKEVEPASQSVEED